jgi:hypothetical protein
MSIMLTIITQVIPITLIVSVITMKVLPLTNYSVAQVLEKSFLKPDSLSYPMLIIVASRLAWPFAQNHCCLQR